MIREAIDLATPEELLLQKEFKALLCEALCKMPARHERAVRLRYGLGINNPGTTLRQVGECFGVIPERARQIVRKVERRLARHDKWRSYLAHYAVS